MTEKRLTIAEIPDQLAMIRHVIEEGDAIELMQEGEAFAVLISLHTFHNLTREQPTFWEALQAFRHEHAQELLQLDGGEFEGLRDRSSGDYL